MKIPATTLTCIAAAALAACGVESGLPVPPHSSERRVIEARELFFVPGRVASGELLTDPGDVPDLPLSTLERVKVAQSEAQRKLLSAAGVEVAFDPPAAEVVGNEAERYQVAITEGRLHHFVGRTAVRITSITDLASPDQPLVWGEVSYPVGAPPYLAVEILVFDQPARPIWVRPGEFRSLVGADKTAGTLATREGALDGCGAVTAACSTALDLGYDYWCKWKIVSAIVSVGTCAVTIVNSAGGIVGDEVMCVVLAYIHLEKSKWCSLPACIAVGVGGDLFCEGLINCAIGAPLGCECMFNRSGCEATCQAVGGYLANELACDQLLACGASKPVAELAQLCKRFGGKYCDEIASAFCGQTMAQVNPLIGDLCAHEVCGLGADSEAHEQIWACKGRQDGTYCETGSVLMCQDGVVVGGATCALDCASTGQGTAKCKPVPASNDPCAPASQVSCGTGECIEPSSAGDGAPDCLDGSDEPGLTEHPCIQQRCDGVADCPGAQDEAGCEQDPTDGHVGFGSMY